MIKKKFTREMIGVGAAWTVKPLLAVLGVLEKGEVMSKFWSVWALIAAFVSASFGQEPPANLVTYYNDPPEAVTTNVANGVTEFILQKELGSYANYGVADGAANILYTGEAATWHFNLPASVNPAAINSAFIRASLIADDHYGVSLNAYSLAAWTNGVYLGDSIAGLPHGSPYGSRFNNWQQRDFTIRYPSPPFSLTLFNTSGVGNWFAIDWIELHVFVQSNAAPVV
jgi:hypothetical protein